MDHYCHLKKIFWPARSLLRIKTGRSDIPSLWTRLEITVGLKAMWFFFVQTLMVALGLSLLTFVVSGYGQWHDVTWHDNDFSKSPFLCHQGGGRFKRFLRNHCGRCNDEGRVRLRSAEGKTHSGAGGGHRISEVGARWRQKCVGRGVARADSREGQRSFPPKKKRAH